MVVVTVDRQPEQAELPPVNRDQGWVHAPEAEELLGEASDVVAAGGHQGAA